MWREVAHVPLVVVSFLCWCVAMTCMAVAGAVALLDYKLLPNARISNCWSYAMPRWVLHGGYLLIRYADGQKFLGFLPLAHCIWVKKIPRHGPELEQFLPKRRRFSKWFPWYTVLYEGAVDRRERPHNAHEHSA